MIALLARILRGCPRPRFLRDVLWGLERSDAELARQSAVRERTDCDYAGADRDLLHATARAWKIVEERPSAKKYNRRLAVEKN